MRALAIVEFKIPADRGTRLSAEPPSGQHRLAKLNRRPDVEGACKCVVKDGDDRWDHRTTVGRTGLAGDRYDGHALMNGLAMQVQQALLRDPHAGDVYVFRGRSGQHPPRQAAVGSQNDVPAADECILLTLVDRDCPQTPVRLRLAYAHRPNVCQPLDTSLTTHPSANAIFPIFYRATQNFDGILLQASHAACTVRLFRLPLSYFLPLALTAMLPDNWPSLPFRKGLGYSP
jgi:hypothetical protein